MNLGSMSASPRDLDLARARSEAGGGALSWPPGRASLRDILPITDLKQRNKMKETF